MPTKQKNKRIIIAIIISIISVYALIACEKPDDSIRNEKPVEAEKYFTIQYLAEEGGYIKGEPKQKVAYMQTSAFVKAIPNEGYVFVKWTDGETRSYRADLAVEDITVKAVFEVAKLKVQYMVGREKGYIVGETNQIISYGQDCREVLAIPAEGYRFVKWSDGEKNPQRQDICITENQCIFAEFAPIYYTIKFQATEGGKVRVGNKVSRLIEQQYIYKEVITDVTAIADEHYHFVRRSDGYMLETRKFDCTQNLDLTAVFEKDSYDVLYSASIGGMLAGNSRQKVEYGQDADAIEAYPLKGYKFLYWSDGYSEALRRDLNIVANINVVAIFIETGIS